MKVEPFVLLDRLQNPEVTTAMLLEVFASSSNPRRIIHNLAGRGVLLSLKQGVYLLQHSRKLRPYSLELFANMIYGPSYISLESALAHYGLIPEKVQGITSVCMGKSRTFMTPLGTFSYHHTSTRIYSQGVRLMDIDGKSWYQCASPEKALLDLIYVRESVGNFRTPGEFFDYVLDSYRIHFTSLKDVVATGQIQELNRHYQLKRTNWFTSELIKRLS